MKLARKNMFRASIVIAAVSFSVYIVHVNLVGTMSYLGEMGYVLLWVAFVLACLHLTIKIKGL